MNDLLSSLEDAISETERIALAANHNGRWFTYGDDGPDEGRLYVLNGEDPKDGWAIANFVMYPNGTANAPGDPNYLPTYSSMPIFHIANVIHAAHNDPQRVLRRVARDRKLLARHKPFEVWAGHITGKPWLMAVQCSHCREDGAEAGMYDNLSMPSVWPCGDVRDLAEDYELEVPDHV